LDRKSKDTEFGGGKPDSCGVVILNPTGFNVAFSRFAASLLISVFLDWHFESYISPESFASLGGETK